MSEVRVGVLKVFDHEGTPVDDDFCSHDSSACVARVECAFVGEKDLKFSFDWRLHVDGSSFSLFTAGVKVSVKVTTEVSIGSDVDSKVCDSYTPDNGCGGIGLRSGERGYFTRCSCTGVGKGVFISSHMCDDKGGTAPSYVGYYDDRSSRPGMYEVGYGM